MRVLGWGELRDRHPARPSARRSRPRSVRHRPLAREGRTSTRPGVGAEWARRARPSGHQHRGRRAGRRVGVGAGVGKGGGSQPPNTSGPCSPRLFAGEALVVMATESRGAERCRDGDDEHSHGLLLSPVGVDEALSPAWVSNGPAELALGFGVRSASPCRPPLIDTGRGRTGMIDPAKGGP